jgi:hypothetical protein
MAARPLVADVADEQRAQADQERQPRPLALSRSAGSASAFAAILTVVVQDRIALMRRSRYQQVRDP